MSAVMDAHGVDLDDLARLTPARLGSLLREARASRSMSLELVARRAAVQPRRLRQWEKGRDRPMADEIVRLANALDMDVDDLVPPRSPVRYHIGTGTITVGHQTVAVVQCATDGDGNDAVLRTYVDAVSRSRGCPPASAFALRRDDIAALVQLLDLQDAELEARLQRLLGLSAPDAAVLHSRLISRRVAFAAAASISALAAIPLAGAASGAGTVATRPPAAIEQSAQVIYASPASVVAPPTPVTVATTPAPPTDAPEAATVPAPGDHEVSPVQLPDDADGDGIDIGDAMVIERGTPSPDSTTDIGDTVTYSR